VNPRVVAAPARPVIEDVRPRVDDGRYDAKGIIGDAIRVEADAFADGHDLLRVEIHYRPAGTRAWATESMVALGNDRWRATFTPTRLGRHEFVVQAGIDHFGTWQRDLTARIEAGQDVALELLVGALQVREAAARARGVDRKRLSAFADDLDHGDVPDALSDGQLAGLVGRYASGPRTSSPTYGVHIERVRARFSTWYELFPRSASSRPTTHGTLADVRARLDYLAGLGIDVL
jgi:starch synthase (maltosyl-transferring)